MGDPRERLIEDLLDRKRREQSADQQYSSAPHDFSQTEDLVKRLLEQHSAPVASRAKSSSGGGLRDAEQSSYTSKNGGNVRSADIATKFDSAQLYLREDNMMNNGAAVSSTAGVLGRNNPGAPPGPATTSEDDLRAGGGGGQRKGGDGAGPPSGETAAGFKFYKQEEIVSSGSSEGRRFDNYDSRIPVAMESAVQGGRPRSVPPASRRGGGVSTRTSRNSAASTGSATRGPSTMGGGAPTAGAGRLPPPLRPSTAQPENRANSYSDQPRSRSVGGRGRGGGSDRPVVVEHSDGRMALEDRAVMWANQYKRGLERRAKQKQQQEDEELKKHTFRPQRSGKDLKQKQGGSLSPGQSTIYQYASEHLQEAPEERFNRLHHEADQRLRIRAKAKTLLDENELQDYTFRPTINERRRR